MQKAPYQWLWAGDMILMQIGSFRIRAEVRQSRNRERLVSGRHTVTQKTFFKDRLASLQVRFEVKSAKGGHHMQNVTDK